MGVIRGGNKTGIKWNKGGALSRGKMLSVDFSNFAEYAERLDQLGANLEQIIGDAMEKAAEKVQADVTSAMDNSNLPAGGRYSQGETRASIIKDPKTNWEGSYGTIKLGFDKTKPGAGGFLITGTPKMAPNYSLEDIFERKTYATKINNMIKKELQSKIDEYMGG